MGALVLLVVGGAAWFFTTAEERTRTLQIVVSQLRQLRKTIDQHRLEPQPHRDALRARAPLPFVTIGLVAVNVLAFAVVVAGGGDLERSGRTGLVGRELRSANDERRVVAAPVGRVPPRQCAAAGGQRRRDWTGWPAAGAPRRAARPCVRLPHGGHPRRAGGPRVAPDGGQRRRVSFRVRLYGLLASSTIWTFRRHSDVTMSWDAARRLLPVAAVFVFVQLVSGGFGAAESHGAPGRRRHRRDPVEGDRRTAAAAASRRCGRRCCHDRRRRVGDAAPRDHGCRPEIRRIVEIEGRTAHDYDLAATQFRLGAVNAKSLAQLIDGTILPELRQARSRVKALVGVPPEHQPLVASAEEYLRLRDRELAPALRSPPQSQHEHAAQG